MTAALEGDGWSAARPGRTLPPGKTRYPLYRRLDGPQGRSGRAEYLVPTGIRFRTVQPVAQSLYRLSYPAHPTWRVAANILYKQSRTGDKVWSSSLVVRFGAWNVRILYRAGSLIAAVRELARYKLYMVGVQDVRWDKGGTISMFLLWKRLTIKIFGNNRNESKFYSGRN